MIRYERKEHVITTIIQDDAGHVIRTQKNYKTINAAKRASRNLQLVDKKRLGGGVVSAIE